MTRLPRIDTEFWEQIHSNYTNHVGNQLYCTVRATSNKIRDHFIIVYVILNIVNNYNIYRFDFYSKTNTVKVLIKSNEIRLLSFL